MGTPQKRVSKMIKLADFYLGVPIIYLLGKFRKKRKKPSTIKRIAMLKTSGMGDVILLSAIIDQILKNNNQSIYLFVGQNNQAFAHYLSKNYTNLTAITLEINKPWQAIKIIRQFKFDLWLDFGPWPRINSLLSFAAKAKYTAGFKTKNQHRHFIFDYYSEHKHNCHEIDNYHQLANEVLNIGSINIPQTNISFTASTNQTPTIILHLFSAGSKQKLIMLPDSTWLEIIKKIQQTYGDKYKIILTGAKKDYQHAKQIQQTANSKLLSLLIATDSLSIVPLIQALNKASLVVSIDTGVMHLASYLACNLLAIHGPSHQKYWGALHHNATIINPNYHCAPCLRLGFESNCNNNLCLQSLSADSIFAKIQQKLP